MENITPHQSTTNLDFGDYNFDQFDYIQPQKPSLNANLYTWEPFYENGGHRSFPVIADATYMTHVNLRSANPPPNAVSQFTDTIRPGNNGQMFPKLKNFSNTNIFCRNSNEVTPMLKSSHSFNGDFSSQYQTY